MSQVLFIDKAKKYIHFKEAEKMKKLYSILLAVIMVISMMAVSVSAKSYEVSGWFEDVNDELELTWSENPKANVSKGEFMFSFLRMIQASHVRNDEPVLKSDTDLDFKDVDELNDNEQDEARILVDLGVLNGYKGYMNMDNDVTRAEAAKILFYFNEEFDLDIVRSSPDFEDTDDHWAQTYINFAYRIEMVNGRSDEIYDPEGNLTIQEMIQIMYNISEAESDFSKDDIAYALTHTFNVETDLDIEDYDFTSIDDEFTLYLSIGEVVTYSSDEATFWESSDEDIVSVSKRGKITAEDEGIATISNNDGISIKVTVAEPIHYLNIGSTITPYMLEGDWETSNRKIATVDEYGHVEGHRRGTATITLEDEDIEFTVEVVNEEIVYLDVGETKKLGSSSSWESEDEDVVTVTSKGYATAVDAGITTVSSRNDDYIVVVTAPSVIRMNIGDELEFEGISNWETSNKRVVAVNDEIIEAKREGIAIISSNSYTFTVVVGDYMEDYDGLFTLATGETKELDFGNGWKSDDKDIVSITKAGKLTANEAGETYIYNNDDEQYLVLVVEGEEFERTIEVGTAMYLGDGSYDSSWESEDETIAEVDNYGFVSAIAPGKVIISNDEHEYVITVVNEDDDDDDDDNKDNNNNTNDDDYDYGRTIVYAEGFEPSSYYNAWTGDTIKIVVESEDGKLKDVILSNSKCKLTKKITSLGSNKYTFTVESVSAGACILTLDFEEGTDFEFTINSYKE